MLLIIYKLLFTILCTKFTLVYCKGITEDSCSSILSEKLTVEIDGHSTVVNQIINATLYGDFKGKTWTELSEFVDTFGPRFTGTDILDNAINYVIEKSANHFNLENVHGESVPVPHWIRGEESAALLTPRYKKMSILGLGYSVGTPKNGITASAIVVKSFGELNKRSKEIPGKIVVFNEIYTNYGETVKYRSRGAIEAAKFGAIAVLIRSITPFSINSPHTGMMVYEKNVIKIPAACITVEDAHLLGRFAARNKSITIKLMMEAKQLFDNKTSHNVISEIKGSTMPEKVVVVSGHIDSWDVGQGAMDDGAGAFVAWNSLVLLRSLNLRSKRTIRSIMWTAEEMGIIGARYYIQQHKSEVNNLQFVMESDIGTFLPLGWEVTASPEIICIIKRILSMLHRIGKFDTRTPQAGPDIEEWVNLGISGASLWNKNDRYFWFHHSEGDTMDVENSQYLDIATALFAATSYIIANISIDFPHTNSTHI